MEFGGEHGYSSSSSSRKYSASNPGSFAMGSTYFKMIQPMYGSIGTKDSYALSDRAFLNPSDAHGQFGLKKLIGESVQFVETYESDSGQTKTSTANIRPIVCIPLRHCVFDENDNFMNFK